MPGAVRYGKLRRIMIRFFFGHGWMVAWHVGLLLTLLLGVGIPLISMLPLKAPGQTPDTPSVGSFGVVFSIAATTALITAADCALLSVMLPGPWFHKLVLTIGFPTLIAGLIYWPAVMLAEKQSLPMMLLVLAGVVVVVVVNLMMLRYAAASAGTESLRFSVPVLIVLSLLSVPLAAGILLIPLGLILERFQK